MKASTLFKEYAWLVDTIGRSDGITLRKLNERWLQTYLSQGQPFSRTSFRRHRREVEEMFGILIQCDEDNRYYIDDATFTSSDSVTRWMISTLTVSNIISEARILHNRILLESIPAEGEHLGQLVEAMRAGLRVTVVYRRYGSREHRTWTLDPYCIKLFRRRWYLLGRFPAPDDASDDAPDDASLQTIVLSFDRIKSLTTTDEPFTVDPHFDAKAYFASYFGVMVDSRIETQTILLRAYGQERYSMSDLPLHPTQRKVAAGPGYIDYKVRLRPTSDFLAHILSRGRWLKVLAPDDIAQQIKQMHQEAAEAYQ